MKKGPGQFVKEGYSLFGTMCRTGLDEGEIHSACISQPYWRFMLWWGERWACGPRWVWLLGEGRRSLLRLLGGVIAGRNRTLPQSFIDSGSFCGVYFTG